MPGHPVHRDLAAPAAHGRGPSAPEEERQECRTLADGDTVTVVKTLKVKGSPTGIKAGTKVRNIRLVDGVDGHDTDCKVDGFGAMQLKSSGVKKV
ncbi:alkylphosphonate utilization protein [Streptomyces sp. NPDC001165]|uniref:alkylphosphonate utilization protein n=1 Tax=Streptomyces sp. NPDC001165 TaxID=3364546 RepID=UPI0036AAE74A